jgi:hypothetical protein
MTIDFNKLDKNFASKLTDILNELKSKHGLIFQPFYGLRSCDEQSKLWRVSRDTATIKSKISELRNKNANFLADSLEKCPPQKTGAWKTNAIGGFSWHQYGLAADCVLLKNGVADWNDIASYEIYRKVAIQHGCSIATKTDWVHIQLPKETSPSQLYSLSEIDSKMKKLFS